MGDRRAPRPAQRATTTLVQHPMTHPSDTRTPEADDTAEQVSLPCVMVFNANDPSGAGGLGADVAAMSSASAHVLPVVTGTYVRDTSEVHDHIAFDEEAVADQARAALEDMPVQAFKVGFVGNPENLSYATHHLRHETASPPTLMTLAFRTLWKKAIRCQAPPSALRGGFRPGTYSAHRHD